MQLNFSAAAVVLALVSVCAYAEEVTIVGQWEGKSGKGKTVGIELNDDRSLELTEDGKSVAPPGGKAKWELVDADKGHLDFILSADGKEVRLPMLVEMTGGKLKIGGPGKDGKRAATMDESDDPTVFTRMATGLAGKWEGKSKTGKVTTLDLRPDHTMGSTEDGKEAIPAEAKAKWELVDGDKGHLDFIFTAEGKEVRIPMLVESKDGKITIGGPKGDKRAATMAESDDPIEFTRK